MVPDEPDEEAVSGARAVERLTYFSDAVVAIAITLLAIDLPVPSGSTVSELWTSFRHDDGHYVAFLISFAVIAARGEIITTCSGRSRAPMPRLLQLDCGWLLTIVLNPFATRLLVASDQTVATHALRFGFYALLQVLESAMLYVMLRYMTAHQLAGLPDLAVKNQARKSLHPDARLRAVDPGLLRHHLRLGAVVRRTGADQQARSPAP